MFKATSAQNRLSSGIYCLFALCASFVWTEGFFFNCRKENFTTSYRLAAFEVKNDI